MILPIVFVEHYGLLVALTPDRPWVPDMFNSHSLPPHPPRWDGHYPAPDALRREVDAMRDAFVTALFEAVPPSALSGIYAKGSAQKPWDSPLDYVPELSDVDIHILFVEDAEVRRYLGTVEGALGIQARIESLYRSAVAAPIHVPRLQVIVANVLWRQPDYVPSPEHTVTILHGTAPPHSVQSADVIRRIDATLLLEHEPYLAEVPFNIVDMPDKHIWPLLRGLTWRVSPIAPRVLSLYGIPFEEAWGENRTRAVTRLRSAGEDGLAVTLTEYYLNGWQYFLSGFTATDAARAAVLAGTQALSRAIDIARARQPG